MKNSLLLDPTHIAYLAQVYIALDSNAPALGCRQRRDVAAVAQALAWSNIDAETEQHTRPGNSQQFVDQCMTAADSAEFESFEPAQVIKSALCYRYHAMQDRDYERSIAAQIVEETVNAAAHQIARDPDLVWGAPVPVAGGELNRAPIPAAVPDRPRAVNTGGSIDDLLDSVAS